MAKVEVAAVGRDEGEADMGLRSRGDQIGPARNLPCKVNDPTRATAAPEFDYASDITARTRRFIADDP